MDGLAKKLYLGVLRALQRSWDFVSVVKITYDGQTVYCRRYSGTFHRIGGPAVIGTYCVSWYKDGEPHREDGPAVIMQNVGRYWYIRGKKHRFGGPAVDLDNGTQEWWVFGNRITRINPHQLPGELSYTEQLDEINWLQEGF